MHAKTATEHLFSSKEEMVEHMKATARAQMMNVPEAIRESIITALVEAALANGFGRKVSDDEAQAMLAEAVVLDD